jgi:hypothetical protein
MKTAPWARVVATVAASVIPCAAAWAADTALASSGPGLRPDGLPYHWTRLQARLGLGVGGSTFSGSLRPDAPQAFGAGSEGLQLKSLNVMGDFYLTPSSRFRATGGVLLGSREQPWSAPPKLSLGGVSGLSVDRRGTPGADHADGAVPYLGVGYSDISLRGRWGFAADVGVMALNPRSGVRLGRAFNGSQAMEEFLRELRLEPTVQLGVTYSF